MMNLGEGQDLVLLIMLSVGGLVVMGIEVGVEA